MTWLKPGLFASLATATVALLVMRPAMAATQSDSKPAGAAASILFLSLDPTLDGTYRTNLLKSGYAVVTASLKTKLDPAFIRSFNVIVIDQTVKAGNQYALFGQYTMDYQFNMNNVWSAVNDGAGLLIYPNLNDCGGIGAAGFNQEIKPLGLRIYQAGAVDLTRLFNKWQAYGINGYTWTEAIAPHPATEGLKRIYYAAGNARWDDCYLTPPLNMDTNWTVLVKGMPESMIGVSVACKWSPMEAVGPTSVPVLAAVRTVGKGRMAAFALSPNYVHRFGYTLVKGGMIGEAAVGPIDGIVLEKGDGQVPSDTGKFVMQLYRWLGENSKAGGLGGYQGGAPVVLADTGVITNYQSVLELETMAMPPSWKHRATSVRRASGESDFPELADPVTPGEIRYFKGLIGARTKYSDGKGTVAEYAQAARAAGYSVIVFSETFEKLSATGYAELMADCEKNTTADLVCLPGFDIMDPWDNHFLLIAAPFYPRPQWLSADGKRLAQPACINLCYGDHMVAAHRTTKGTVPVERLKHYQAFSVFTYRDGKLVEDATTNYAWQAESASVPHPLAVHEIFSPAEVAGAARTGYQQIMPSDTPANAAGYFRSGLEHYFEAPARFMLSGGPIATAWVGTPKDAGPASENRDFMRLDIAVTNEGPIASVELKDGYNTVRRWVPGTNVFSVSTFFRHSQQRDLYVVAHDAAGRGLLTSVFRTVPRRYHFRCSDRQNWLGHVAAWYPGQHLPFDLNVSLPVQGTEEGTSVLYNRTRGTCMAAKLNYPYTSPDVAVLRAVLDEKYTQALREDVGADANPSLPSEPSTVYEGAMTTYTFTGKSLSRCPVLVEYDLTLKRDVKLANNLFPGFGAARAKSRLWLQAGQIYSITNEVKGEKGFDIPAFGLGCGFIPLQPGGRIANGQFGMAPPPLTNGLLLAGTRLQGKFLLAGTGAGVPWSSNGSAMKDETAWMTQFGFLGKLPYTVTLRQGSMEMPTFPVKVTAKDGLLAGSVTEVCTNMAFDVPLEFTGMNPNWPAGSWREGDALIAYTGVFEGRAWPRLDVGKAGKFIAGQLVTASEPAAKIDVVVWTKGRVKLDVNNPTDKPMKLTVQTAKLPGFKSLKKTIELPAGTSRFVEVK